MLGISRIINYVIKKNINGVINIGTGKGVRLEFLVKQITKKLKTKTLLRTSKKKDKIVADISLIKSKNYKFKYNEKYTNF